MTTPAAQKRLEQTIWILIYGGLFLLVFGIATRGVDGWLSHVCVVVGTVAAAAGVVLIYVRSRQKDAS